MWNPLSKMTLGGFGGIDVVTEGRSARCAPATEATFHTLARYVTADRRRRASLLLVDDLLPQELVYRSAWRKLHATLQPLHLRSLRSADFSVTSMRPARRVRSLRGLSVARRRANDSSQGLTLSLRWRRSTKLRSKSKIPTRSQLPMHCFTIISKDSDRFIKID